MVKKQKHFGFSLVEISIVLVIIGLITSLILYGNGMIESARLRTVIKEAEEYRNAINRFKEKFQALPGDHPATDYSFGYATTSSGDGDGLIEYSSTDTTPEHLQAWKHLYDQQFINDNLTGTESTAGGSEIGTNIPASRGADGAGWEIGSDTSQRNYLQLGKAKASSAAENPSLTPKLALLLDKKSDDGDPTKGYILGEGTESETGCYTTDSEGKSTYNQLDTEQCKLRMTFDRVD